MSNLTEKKNRSRKKCWRKWKSVLKLINDAVYGKKIGNLRSRIDLRLVSNEKDFLKWTSKPSSMSQKIFQNDLVAVRKSKITLTLNKSFYVRMCILDLSKVLMYKFHYDYVKNKNGNNSRLLLADTDSLMYKVKTENVYENFSRGKKMYDFGNYSGKPKYYDDSNKSVVDEIKDKTVGLPIEEFVGLKPKMYSFLVGNSMSIKKQKVWMKML